MTGDHNPKSEAEIVDAKETDEAENKKVDASETPKGIPLSVSLSG